MGNPIGFLEIDKKERNYEDPKDRLKHFKEFIVPLTNEEVSNRVLDAWTVAYPIVIKDVRLIILYLIGMIWFISMNGKKL